MRLSVVLICALLAAACGTHLHAASPPAACTAPDRWRSLPPTPSLPKPEREGLVAVKGSRLWYGEYGTRNGGVPVLLLHGGLGNSSYFGDLIPALVKAGYHVVALDSRGHGRSAPSSLPYTYPLMAQDVVKLLDHLKIAKVDLVGWSDGGTIGYHLALDAAGRLHRLLAFGANATLGGLKSDYAATPTFAAYIARTEREYRALAPSADAYPAFLKDISRMWGGEPLPDVAALRAVKAPATIVVGQYDEAMRIDHAAAIADAIPGANLVVLPNVSHFAMLQCPGEFDDAVLQFLKWR